MAPVTQAPWHQRLHPFLPQRGLSRFAGLMANCNIPRVKNYLIRDFLGRFPVDLSEAVREQPEDYTCFNDFFTRQLKPGKRIIAPAEKAIACPVDGKISEFGEIEGSQLFQAKGRHYTLSELLGDERDAPKFENGYFMTLYLAPHDYHRVHSPLKCKITAMRYVPGRLYSVNPFTVGRRKRLFSRNERVVLFCETAFGPMCVILVGAMLVASIHTPWAGQVAPRGRRSIQTHHYINADAIACEKGDEVGHFQLGSTVILLFPENSIHWREDMHPERIMRLGEDIGTVRHGI